MSAAPDSEVFMTRVDALLQDRALGISPLAAGLVVALDMGIADSRAFSRVFGVEHALVLREVAQLSGPDGLIEVRARHARSLRATLALTARGAALLKDRLQLASA